MWYNQSASQLAEYLMLLGLIFCMCGTVYKLLRSYGLAACVTSIIKACYLW